MEKRSVRVGHEHHLLTVAAIPTSAYGNKVRVAQPVFHYQHKMSSRQHISFKDCYFGIFAKFDIGERQQGEKGKTFEGPRLDLNSK